MTRILRTCQEFAMEMNRELFQSGITVPVKHYQNKKLEGKDRLTKEIIGVNFCISNPLKGRREMLEFLFPNDADRIEKYCIQEFKDRISPVPLNPGNSYKIREDLWMEMLEGDKFSYSYSERLYDKWQHIINALKDDIHTRQAVMQVFQPSDTSKYGAITRIPCSLSYQYLIRNNQLHCIYTMRSSAYFQHLGIDIWLAAESIRYLVDQLKETYSELTTGKLYYQAGSLHAYSFDLSDKVLF